MIPVAIVLFRLAKPTTIKVDLQTLQVAESTFISCQAAQPLTWCALLRHHELPIYLHQLPLH